MYILKEVCFMTTSFPAIHFLYYIYIFYILSSLLHFLYFIIISRVCLLRVCLFQENNCGPAFLEVPIYSTELVAIFFFEKYRVKCTKVLTELPFFHGDPA